MSSRLFLAGTNDFTLYFKQMKTVQPKVVRAGIV
jgi:hypothetical protein